MSDTDDSFLAEADLTEDFGFDSQQDVPNPINRAAFEDLAQQNQNLDGLDAAFGFNRQQQIPAWAQEGAPNPVNEAMFRGINRQEDFNLDDLDEAAIDRPDFFFEDPFAEFDDEEVDAAGARRAFHALGQPQMRGMRGG